ncbi:unnamed protein product, partial [Allacma fusca]
MDPNVWIHSLALCPIQRYESGCFCRGKKSLRGIHICWPVPKLSWWRENALLDDDYEVSLEHAGATVVTNTLTMPKLTRADLEARLTCQASNSNISVPVSTTVTLDMS